MTDDEFLSVLVDTAAGLSPTEGYEPTIEHARGLIAERGLRQGLDRLGNTLFEERDQARAERDLLQAVVDNFEGALRAIYADDTRAADSQEAAYHAYRHRQGLARWALRQQGLVSRNDRSAQALIIPVAGPTSPEYQQVVDRLFEMAEEQDRLLAVARAAIELLEEDRTSWSDYHTALDTALAAVRWTDTTEERT